MQSKQQIYIYIWTWELDLGGEGEGEREDDPGLWLRQVGGGALQDGDNQHWFIGSSFGNVEV